MLHVIIDVGKSLLQHAATAADVTPLSKAPRGLSSRSRLYVLVEQEVVALHARLR